MNSDGLYTRQSLLYYDYDKYHYECYNILGSLERKKTMMNPYTKKKKNWEKEYSSFLFLKSDSVCLYMNGRSIFSILLLTTLVVEVVMIQ